MKSVSGTRQHCLFFLVLMTMVPSLLVLAEKMLTSPVITSKGVWNPVVATCAPGMYVTAVDVRSHEFPAPPVHDALGLVAAVFQCSDPLVGVILLPENVIATHVEGVSITISTGPPGEETYQGPSLSILGIGTTAQNITIGFQLPLRTPCGERSVAVGFQLNSETGEGIRDNTAANNIRLICSDQGAIAEGFGEYRGTWTEGQLCGPRKALCGVQGQGVAVNVLPREGDHIALENLRMKCCDLPNPAETCSPTAVWDLIERTEPSTQPKLCNYTTAPRLGIELVAAMTTEQLKEHEFNIAVGFDIREDVKGRSFPGELYKNILTANPQPPDYNFDWGAAASRTWFITAFAPDPVAMPAPFDCSGTIQSPAGYISVVEVHQLVAACSTLSVRTGLFKRVVRRTPYNGDTETQTVTFFGN